MVVKLLQPLVTTQKGLDSGSFPTDSILLVLLKA